MYKTQNFSFKAIRHKVCLYRATPVAFTLYCQTTVHASMYKVTTSLVLKVEKIMNKCPLIKNNV